MRLLERGRSQAGFKDVRVSPQPLQSCRPPGPAGSVFPFISPGRWGRLPLELRPKLVAGGGATSPGAEESVVSFRRCWGLGRSVSLQSFRKLKNRPVLTSNASSLSDSVSASLSPLIYFFFFSHPCSMWKLPGQGLNQCHSSDLDCSGDSAGSSTL